MGLDITACRKLVKVECTVNRDEDEECEECEHVRLYVEPDFPEVADGMSGCYRVEGLPENKPYYMSKDGIRVFGFRAGSYSGYDWWRTSLCKIMLGVKPEMVWNNPDAFKGKPFVELINFSDCEGTIGSVTAAKLYKDFVEYLPKAKAALESGDPEFVRALQEWGWLHSYENWMKAFELAADQGAVLFH